MPEAAICDPIPKSALMTARLSVAEQWRPVVGFEGYYEVSNLGRVRSLAREARIRNRWGGITTRRIPGQVISQSEDRSRYGYGRRRVKLAKAGRKSAHLVHRLVAEAFLGPIPEGCEVAHNNGFAWDNRATNIRYATPAENAADRYHHGTHRCGEQIHSSRLTEDQILEIKACAGVEKQAVTALRYGISVSQVSRIQNGKRWGHVA